MHFSQFNLSQKMNNPSIKVPLLYKGFPQEESHEVIEKDRDKQKGPNASAPPPIDLEKVKRHIARLVKNYKLIRGCIDMEEVLIFEPKSVLQKMRAVFQNTFEIQLLLLSIFICFKLPSLLTMGLLVLNHDVIYGSLQGNERRLNCGLQIVGFNCFVLFVVVAWKAYYQQLLSQMEFPDQHAFDSKVNFLHSMGFVTVSEATTLKLSVDFKLSLKSESIMLAVYLWTLFRIFMIQRIIANLRKRYINVIILKNHQYNEMIDTDSETEFSEMVAMASIGSKNVSHQESKRLQKKKYKKWVHELKDKTQMNYLGCHYIQKLNKVLYILVIMLQLTHSMGFNGLYDIPQLLLILALFGFFAFRKMYHVGYGLLNFFAAFYFQLALTVKLMYLIAIRISFVNEFLTENQDKQLVQHLRIVFGKVQATGEHPEMELVYYFTMISCIVLAQFWQQTKWIDIREKAKHNSDLIDPKSNLVRQFLAYIDKRFQLVSIHDQIKYNQMQALKEKQKKKRKGSKAYKKKSFFDFLKGDTLSLIKEDLNKYLPTIILWCIRFLMTIQAYMYHNKNSMGHLAYVLLTFVMPQQFVLFLTAVLITPIYFIEFIIVYGLRIPYVKDTQFFQTYGQQFNFEMKFPVLEQLLYFVILILLFISVSCFKLGNDENQNEILTKFMFKKIKDKDSSLSWKILFFVLKYIQTIALIAIFINVSNNLNHFRNLGFMLFFVVYTASEYLYRKTSKLLVVFVSFFISGQFYYSLVYKKFQNDELIQQRLLWLGLYEEDTKPSWNEGDSIYFRHTPYSYDWVILLLMCALNFINSIFINEKFSEQLMSICYNSVRDKYAEQIFALIRFKNSIGRYVIFLAMGIMFYFIGRAQTNLINWGFFVLNILNFAFIAKGDNKLSTNKHSKRIAEIIKVYSAFFLILEIMFIVFVGEKEKPLEKESLDQQLKQKFAFIYANFDIIGFRIWFNPSQMDDLEDSVRAKLLKNKFYSYISYLMISIYLSDHFDSKIKRDKGLDQYTEEDFKKIFEFESQAKRIQRERRQRDQQRQLMGQEDDGPQEDEQNALTGRNSMTDQYTARNQDRDDSSQDDKEFRELYKKSMSNKVQDKDKKYSAYDLLDIYENVRYTTPFVVFKWIDYWPYLDIIASYGHIINNMLIVIIAIYYNVSFFMCFNILCICLFYSVATYRLNMSAMKNYKESGLQSQTDLKIAKMITKKYKQDAFQVFLRIRHLLWKIQFITLIIVACLGFASNLLLKYRIKLNYQDAVYHRNSIALIDKVTFYVFMAGLYKDEKENGKELYFYLPVFVLMLGFTVERVFINWLTNRHGLTYDKLQKCIELDLRRQSILENWRIQPPKYSMDSYKAFYYGDDYKEIMENIKAPREKQEKTFVPYKRALRIREFISFSVKLAGRAPELKIDSETDKILTQYEAESMTRDNKCKTFSSFCEKEIKKKVRFEDEEEEESEHGHDSDVSSFHSKCHQQFGIDFETVPILREHKIKFYESILKQAVDRKYKISFYKGCQLVLETLTLLILLVSVVLKANIFSLVYIVFIIKYLTSRQKVRLLVRMCVYIAIMFFIQYSMYVFNLTSHTSPAPFPEQLTGYPKNSNPEDMRIKYQFPLFFKYKVLRDLKMAYLVGIGVEKQQVTNLLLDFLNLYFVSMYILHYRNPLLVKTMEKVFWRFPFKYETNDKWQRLTDSVKLQVMWLYRPLKVESPKYNEVRAKMKKWELDIAETQYQFAKNYNKDENQDLNKFLIDYIDLKYEEIWSENMCRRVKMEFKQQSIYYRLVKQGSILVYLTFHIVTILLILLMASLRQSLIALGYVIIVLPNFNDASNVLVQRNIHQESLQQKLDEDIKTLEEQLNAVNEELKKSGRKKNLVDMRNQLTQELWDLQEESLKMKKLAASKTFEQKQDEKSQIKMKSWFTLKLIKKYLMTFAMLDFIFQIVCQLPIIESGSYLSNIGFRKVWMIQNRDLFTYKNYIEHEGNLTQYSGYKLNSTNFYLQSINCLMICMISLQSEIFESPGYKKFVTQKDGSMDLLMQLSDMKAQSLAYCFNNHKIRKIISIQRRRESIYSTVEKIKIKLIKWRIFSRQTLNTENSASSNYTPLLDNFTLEDLTPQQQEQIDVSSLRAKLTVTKEKKSVTFIGEDDLQQHSQVRKAKFVTKQEGLIFRENLAREFVKSKLEKLNLWSKLYLYLNDTFVTKIMFKNEKAQLMDLLQQHSTGEVQTPTELEQIMLEDASQAIQKHYDNRQGSIELYNLIAKSRNKNKSKLLEITNFDKKIKLQQLKRTWQFTRPGSMIEKLFETFFYIMISNTQNLIYLSMMFSMYMNAGFISLIYPISMFGYALLEETRPRKSYWKIIRVYTQILVLIKFIMNLSVMDPFYQNSSFKYYQTYLKIGFRENKGMFAILFYMLPEILILTFLVLNDIQLRLLGLYYQTEKDIETVQDGIQRNIERGDFEQVKRKKIQAANMCLQDYFLPVENQVRYIKQMILEKLKSEAIAEGKDPLQLIDDEESLFKGKLDYQDNCSHKQLKQLKLISKEVHKSSRLFDIDSSSNAKSSPFDALVKDNILQKSLENDNLIYVEGRQYKSQNGLNPTEIQEELDEDQLCCGMSNGDFEGDLDDKTDFIERKNQPKLGFFENTPYFDNLFPSLKIQKPGYDLYGSSTVFLAILAIFIFIFYSSMSVDQASLIDSVKDSNNIFKGEMAVSLIIVIAIIIIERYVNRSDTKAMNKKSIEADATFFKDSEMFKTKKQKTETIQLQTMKTSDLDVQGNSSQEFLKAMYGNDSQNGNQFDSSRTKITQQQKCKYVMHWIILIGSHIFVFWYIPLTGNYMLYGNPECDESLKSKYGCKNFHSNPYLRVFYIIISIYLTLSALQMRYGFTIMKKASSVMQYYTIPGMLGAQVFMAIPFAIEVRCLLDFTFSKTALDIFQFWQLFLYHIELYIVKMGNYSYTYKILGSPTTKLDKCIFGVLFQVIFLGLLIGPIYFFSDYGGFIAPNPVQSGQIKIAFLISKKVSESEMINPTEQINAQQRDFDSLNLQQTVSPRDNDLDVKSEIPFFIYENKYPFFRQYDEEYYEKTNFNKWTETRYFKPEMLQDCISNEYSDDKWMISDDNKLQLMKDLKQAMDPENPNYEFKLGIYYQFDRVLPEEAQTASGQQIKELDLTNLYDCQSAQQLMALADLDCSTPTQGYINNATIRFSQALSSNVVLGAGKNVSELIREGSNHNNERHDLLLQYSCNNQWTAHASSLPVRIPQKWNSLLQVNNKTCKLLNEAGLLSKMAKDKKNGSLASILEENEQTLHDAVIWYRVKLTLLSMMVSASIFASFNITTFYTGVVVIIGSSLRPLLMFYTFNAFLYEITHPDAIIKLIEACYMKRHEEDLIGEEETYRMLQEIVRSPQLLKSLTGSSLKGTCDPILDKLSKEEVIKLRHLDLLERKGYEVSQIKQQIIANRKADDDYNF